jgi:translation initiation factor 5
MENIGASNAGDVFYRYKMPKLVAKVEGRGNGIKTNIVNGVDIARALVRPPSYIIKHFGCELGAQTKFDKKTGTLIVNGAHDAKKLSDLLELFIKKYVQCHKCANPETLIKIRRGCLHLKCKACGHISDADMREKLTTFIVKNPPENVMSKVETKIKKEEHERVSEAKKGAYLDANKQERETVWVSDISTEAQAQRRMELSDASKALVQIRPFGTEDAN